MTRDLEGVRTVGYGGAGIGLQLRVPADSVGS